MFKKLTQLLRGTPTSQPASDTFTAPSSQSNPREFLFSLLPKNSIGVEIGVHMGEFSRLLLDRVQPKELHLIDPWEHQKAPIYQLAWYGGAARGGQQEMDDRYQYVCDSFRPEVESGQVVIHRANSDVVMQQFADGYLDWVYIDGNHLYEFVKLDLELSLQKVKPGGLITGDDYLEGGWWDGGVKRAVDEFVLNPAVEVVEIDGGQYVFRR